MATTTLPVKLLVTVSLVVMLVLGLAVGYAISDETRADMPMEMMSGMDFSDMGEHMSDMSAHMDHMGSKMGFGSESGAPKDMPAMHGHD